jgi:hypothetical protein
MAVVAAVASGGLVLLLHRGGIWPGMKWPDMTGALVWSLCGAAALAGAFGGRLLTAPNGEPAHPARRAAATAVTGLGLLPAAVLAVVAGRNRNDPDVLPMSLGHHVAFATLGAVLGLVVVWTMLAVPALNGAVLAWYGWVAGLLAVVEFEVYERAVLLLVLLAAPVVLAGVLGFAVARAGRSVAVAAAAGVSGLVILAAARWLVAAYWFTWAEQNAPCRVASGECRSTYLMYEVFLIPVLLAVPAAVAVAGAWLGHRWYRRRTARAAGADGGVRQVRS